MEGGLRRFQRAAAAGPDRRGEGGLRTAGCRLTGGPSPAGRAAPLARKGGGPPAAPALLLVRHGATDWNEAGRRQGQCDVPLNERGRREAEEAARILAAWEPVPAAVYSSDLRRAAETARVIATCLGTVPVRLDTRLRERSLGAAEGLTPAELEARFGPLGPDLAEVGAEPVEDLVARFHRAIADMTARHPGQTLVVVSHAGAMTHWLRRWAEGFVTAHPQPLANGEVVALRRRGRRWRYLP